MKKLELGSCVFKVDASGWKHPHFVITEPYGDPLKVIVVNLTDFESYYDKSTAVNIGEHQCVKKKSAVAYRRAQEWDVASIEAEINNGEFETDLYRKESVCSKELILRLRRDFRLSRAKPKKFDEGEFVGILAD